MRRSVDDAGLLGAAFAQVPHGIAVLDTSLTYIAINEALARSNDRPVEEHIGLTVQQALPLSWPQLAPLLHRALGGETVEHTWIDLYVPHRGEARSARAQFQPILRDGAVVGVTVVFEDITDDVRRRRRDALFADLAAALSEASSAQAVARLVGTELRETVHASYTAVWVPDESQDLVDVFTWLSEEEAGGVERLPSRGGSLAMEAASARVALVVGDRASRAAHHPDEPGPGADCESRMAMPLMVENRLVGVLEVGWPKPGDPADGDLEHLRAVATRVGSTVERLSSNAREDRAARRAEALLVVATALNAVRTPEDVAHLIAQSVVDLTQAAEAGVHVLDDAGMSLVRLDGTPGVDPERRSRYDRVPLDARLPASSVVRTGSPVWIETPEHWAAHPDALEDAAAIGWPTIAALPLTSAAEGAAPFGCLFAHYRGSRHVIEEDRRFLRTVAALASSTLERIRSEERDRAARAALDESRRRLHQLGEAGIMGVLEADDHRIFSANQTLLDLLGYDELPDGGLDWRGMTPPGWEPVDDVALAELHDLGVTSPFEKEYIRSDGSVVPVLVSCAVYSYEPFGVVGAVVDLTDRKRLEQRERDGLLERDRLTRAIQSALFPRLAMEGTPYDVDVAYEPGDARMALGGDFYDAVVLDDGRLALLIGDVTGHGPAAAAAGAALRASWRGLVLAGHPLDDLAQLLDQVLVSEREDSDLLQLLATALMVVVAPDGTVEALSAGHPPPLVVGPYGARPLDVPVRLLLGTRFDAGELSAGSFVLGADESLCLFTDGMAEGRMSPGASGRLGIVGLGELLASPEVRSSRDAVSRVADLNGAPLEDDAALMTVRLVG